MACDLTDVCRPARRNGNLARHVGGKTNGMAAAGDKINAFTLVRQLGAGGMGETWEAVRVVGSEFEQRVAIKVADPESLRSKEGMDLFRREASLAASLRHPNIAAVLDVDEQLGCIICELVEGADLRAVLRASPNGTLNASVVVLLLSQLARGLSHAHRRVLHGKLSPVVHRDMSPGNVVIDYDGNLKIVDFGIAKAIASADISETIKGKLSYMAPEQAMGTRVDGRVDQYAVGVMAYEAIAGLRPNDGTHDGETLANILSGKHMPLSQRGCELPEGLDEVIERMLRVTPDERFPTMDGVIDALEPYAPPMTAHRELAEIVQRARPAQTIVMQNGVYVSQPVAHETLQREPTPRGRRRSESGSGPRLPGSGGSSSASGPNPPFTPGDALGIGVHTHTQPARGGQPQTPSSIQPISIKATPRPALPVHEDDDAEARRLTGRPNGRMQALVAGVAALVLGALSWVVFSADSWTTTTTPPVRPNDSAPPSLGPKLPPSSTANTGAPTNPITTAVAPPSAAGYAADKANPGDDSNQSTNPPAPAPVTDARKGEASPSDPLAPLEIKPRRTYRDREKKDQDKDKDKDKEKDKDSASAATKASKNNAIAKVKVFPWGRVWVDGKLQGSVPPILEVNLTPGAHEIAVGHERPMESRSVSLAPGATQLVAFDLEGR
jgi:serine/threonine protein kinase